MLVNVADEEVRLPFLHILASVLAWASAVINPFIYAFKNRQYQQAFAKVTFVDLAPESLIKMYPFFNLHSSERLQNPTYSID